MVEFSYLEMAGQTPWLYLLILAGLFSLYQCFTVLRLAYHSDLSSLPGPRWAKFTGFYRVYQVSSGQAPQGYLDLHEQYGPIVRTGPKTVSIADPSVIPTIYGINSAFIKVFI